MDGITPMLGDHAKEILGAARDQLRGIFGPAAIGQRERSNQEKAAMWQQLDALPEEDQRVMFRDMAARAGHTPNEERPCELCSFVAEHGLGIR